MIYVINEFKNIKEYWWKICFIIYIFLRNEIIIKLLIVIFNIYSMFYVLGIFLSIYI